MYVSLFFKNGDSRGHKGKIPGGKEHSEPIASGGDGHSLLLFIPSICFGYQENIFPGHWQTSVNEQRGKS